MASFTPHGQSNPSLCIDQCLDPPIVRIAWIQAFKVGDVKMAGLPATGVMRSITFWPVNWPVVVKGLICRNNTKKCLGNE